jgi:uncharacterized protein with PIN domain
MVGKGTFPEAVKGCCPNCKTPLSSVLRTELVREGAATRVRAIYRCPDCGTVSFTWRK